MTDAIKTGTILIEGGASMPESLRLEGGAYSSGWRSVSNLDLNELDTRDPQGRMDVFLHGRRDQDYRLRIG